MAANSWPNFDPGNRVIFCGDSGSGKTIALSYAAKCHENAPIIIFETKDEPTLDTIAREQDNIAVIRNGNAVAKAAKSNDVVYYRANLDDANNYQILDEVIVDLMIRLKRNFTIVIDEGYMLHSQSGRAGRGLNGLFTRGRSLGITTMMGVQRPTWISQTCLAQTTDLILFQLSFPNDRKKLSDIFPNLPEDMPEKKYHSYWARGKNVNQLTPFPMLKRTVKKRFLY